jgi:hypothetical protein
MLPRSAPDPTGASVSGGSASGGSVPGDAALGAAVSGGAASDGDASGAVTGAGVIDAPLADVDATFVDIVLRIARAALPLHALAPPTCGLRSKLLPGSARLILVVLHFLCRP